MTRYVALIVTAVLWASAFPAIRAGLAGYAPGHLVLLRFLAGSIALAIVCVVRRCALPSNRDLPRIALLGILGMTLYPLALSFGEQTVEAGTASVLVNLSPAITAILAAYAIGERLNAVGWIGTAIAFLGGALVSTRGGMHTALTAGLIAVLAAAFVQALQFVVAKSLLQRYDAVTLTVFSVWCGTIADLVFARGFVRAVTTAPLGATLAVIYLGVIATAFATILWSYGLARVSAPIATSFLYLVAPVSIAVAYVWLGEVPTRMTWIGALFAVGGVALVSNSTRAIAWASGRRGRLRPVSPPSSRGVSDPAPAICQHPRLR